MSEDTKIERRDTENLLQALTIAIALGAEIPALVGSHFWEVTYFDNSLTEDNVFSIGKFQSKKACETALANWIINEWTETGHTPWKYTANIFSSPQIKEEMARIQNSANPLKAYLSTHTDSEIIDWYFSQVSDKYEINRYTIAGGQSQPWASSVR